MKRKEVNSTRMPVYRDSGFELYNAESTKKAFAGETEHEREPEQYIYSRYRNPTVVSAEEIIMEKEGSDWALLTQSGMSAIDVALSVFQRGSKTGPWLFFSEIYGGTISYIEWVLKNRRGLDIHYFNPEGEAYNLGELEKRIVALKPELIFIETVSNPMLIVADVTEVIRLAKKYGSSVIVDNTFTTSILYKPLQEGADIVIHSATKYLSGHGNITAGVICGNDKGIMKAAIEYRKFTGHMLSPDDAYRLQTHLQTFELRFNQQCRNGSDLALLLEQSPVISKVLYPGLKNHSTHCNAVKLFGSRGFGAMITFDFAGKNDEQKRKRRDNFIEFVSGQIKLVPTLGDPHSILMPVEAVWGYKYHEPGMIRLSVGFEDIGNLKSTISKALNAIESEG